MAVIRCERCNREIVHFDVCNYCGKKICRYCLKASQRGVVKARDRLAICKSCWTDISKRKLYKHREVIFNVDYDGSIRQIA
ncbi:MAG: hypothetical protein ARM1_0052 [Candidatus Micrarchaeota archaeon]|nr:MAG: hypothetical protein ARM1_0052 [Candidatus Micrarchaeota archaeon]